MRELFGADILTFKITVALFFLQLAIAAFLGRLGLAYWPLTLLLAYCVGAFANHANFVIIHNSIHNCVFKNHLLNKLNALLADLSNGFPTAMGFRCYHIKHHSHLSAYDYDADVPSHWEVEWVGDSSWRKAVWLFFFPAIQLMRLSRLKGTVPIMGQWTYINIAVIVAFDFFTLWAFGPNALLYYFLSFWFSVGGLHFLSARWVQEHFAFAPDQEPRLLRSLEHAGAQHRLSQRASRLPRDPVVATASAQGDGARFLRRSRLPSLLDRAALHLHLRSEILAAHPFSERRSGKSRNPAGGVSPCPSITPHL